MNERELTAYCGLYCGDCSRYQARFSESAGALLKEIDTPVFSSFAELAKLKGYDASVSFLEQLRGLNCEQSCRQGGDGCSGEPCEIKKCVEEQKLLGCWDCAQFTDCPKMDFLKPFCEDRHIKNLQKIKKYGLDSWAKHRENQYPWMDALD